MILVDTNAWIQHLRKADRRLIDFLKQQRVRTCDVVIGELLLGSGLPSTFARNLAALPRVSSPTPTETRGYIERHVRVFAGAGVGWSDVQIVLSAARAGARLYTTDRGVRRVCASVGVPLA